ncbi:MAG: DUF615 domain-containing protein [Deltaproteobacteria bacterium]|nr:DUF615 domain-containing protein [Deltaproteobacteria bacterium]
MDQEEKKSKSQVKREMHALEKLGEQLTKLPDGKIKSLGLPEELIEAIRFARTIMTRGAGKRQRQYIGRLMRGVDPQPIEMALAEIHGEHSDSTERFKELERLRDGLVEDDPRIFEEVLERYPHIERQRLMQLVRGARRERELDKPPKSYRVLFAYLRECSEAEDPEAALS